MLAFPKHLHQEDTLFQQIYEDSSTFFQHFRSALIHNCIQYDQIFHYCHFLFLTKHQRPQNLNFESIANFQKMQNFDIFNNYFLHQFQLTLPYLERDLLPDNGLKDSQDELQKGEPYLSHMQLLKCSLLPKFVSRLKDYNKMFEDKGRMYYIWHFFHSNFVQLLRQLVFSFGKMKQLISQSFKQQQSLKIVDQPFWQLFMIFYLAFFHSAIGSTFFSSSWFYIFMFFLYRFDIQCLIRDYSILGRVASMFLSFRFYRMNYYFSYMKTPVCQK